jgi:hypothetical protein
MNALTGPPQAVHLNFVINASRRAPHIPRNRLVHRVHLRNSPKPQLEEQRALLDEWGDRKQLKYEAAGVTDSALTQQKGNIRIFQLSL